MAKDFFKIRQGLTFQGFTAPVNPIDGDVYFDSIQGFLGYQNGSWGPLGGGGIINYNTNPTVGSTNGYNLYNNGAVSTPINGTGGVVTNLTFATTSTSPLVGHTMGVLTKAAANAQGEGLSYDFNIDSGFSPGIINLSFTYQGSANFVLGDGTPATNSDIEMWVYDKTNNVLISVTPYQLTSGVNNPATFQGYFQTNPNSTSYRLIWHIATTNASAWTFNLANIFISPNNLVGQSPGSIVAAHIGYSTSFSLPGSSTLQIPFDTVIFDTAAAFDLATNTYVIPESGWYDISTQIFWSVTQHDNIWINLKVNGTTIGLGQGCVATLASPSIGVQMTIPINIKYKFNAGDQIQVWAQESNGFTETIGGDGVIANFLSIIKVEGANSGATPQPTVKLHVSTSTQGNTGSGTGTVPGTPIVFDSVDQDNYGAYNLGTGTWTCPVSGTYLITAQQQTDHVSNYDWAIDIAYTPVGGSQVSAVHSEWGAQIAGSPSYIVTVNASRHMDLRAGDQIQLQNTGITGNGLRGGNPANFLDIIQLNAPQNQEGQDSTPVGVSLDFMGPVSKIPPNYIARDGSSQLISDYPVLANKLFDPGTGLFCWGSADSLHFNLPPGGVFDRAIDLANAFDPDSGSRVAVAANGNTGNNVGSYQQNQNLSHTHTGPNVNNTNPGASSAFGSGRIGSWTTDASGGNQSNPNNVYVAKIIKYQ